MPKFVYLKICKKQLTISLTRDIIITTEKETEKRFGGIRNV